MKSPSLTIQEFTSSIIPGSRGSGTETVGYWNATFDASTVDSGNYNITVNASDYAGTQHLVNISQIVISNPVPNNSISYPLSNANISGVFVVNATINSSVANLTAVNLSLLQPGAIAFGPIAMNLSQGSLKGGIWNVSINPAALGIPDALYNLSVNATDAQENINISLNRSITIDHFAYGNTGYYFSSPAEV